jgi:hypothetical protein
MPRSVSIDVRYEHVIVDTFCCQPTLRERRFCAFSCVDCERRFSIAVLPKRKECKMNSVNRFTTLAATLAACMGLTIASAYAQSTTTVTGPAGTTTTTTTIGPDGARDTTTVGPRGKTWTANRSRNADGTTNAVRTGPGGVSTVNRARGADGAVDSTVVGPKGGVTTVNRSRGADGAIDSTVTGPKGRVYTVDRARK